MSKVSYYTKEGLKKLKDELPSKSFFNEMHLSLQEIRNKSREKIRFHLTSDSSLIKKIIEPATRGKTNTLFWRENKH